MPNQSNHQLKGKKILFADDELHYIEALIFLAESQGLEVHKCRNASKAIELARTKKIDCIVIDVMMDPGPSLVGTDPQRAGIKAIHEIKKEMPDVGIVCLSVLADQEEIDKLKKLGVIFLRKAETSLDRAWQLIISKITGIYTHESQKRRRDSF